MIRVAIADDEIYSAEQTKKITTQYFQSKGIECKIIIYPFSRELFWDIQEGHYFDIYLIDIEMPVMNGMTLAHEIRQKYDEPYIIFVTSHLEYSIKGYEYNVWRYITKDVIVKKLPLAFDSILMRMGNKSKKFYIIEMHSKIYRVRHDDIYYLHKEGKYISFHTAKGNFRERKAITKAIQDLDAPEFVFADRAYIVNLRHVMTLGDHVLTMRGGTEIPVSIPQFQKIKNAISDYWSRDL